jgi:RNA polymerase sigma factor (sigma-70 family)
MPDAGDMELLRDYHRQGSEEAFAELVRRHIALVYSTAYRHAGIAAQAEEITQAVFVILARKAAGLRPDTILDAWLYETTRLTALNFLRAERRRQFREQEAYMQSTVPESAEVPIWNQLAPLLDEAMARLGKKDREAVVLRFFKQNSLREVAAALRVTEAAAQSRVHRAVEKLQKYFAQRGVHSTAETITGTISTHSVQAAPALLAKAVTAIAVAKGAAASTSTLTLIQGTLKIMAWTKAQTAMVAVAGVLLAAGTTSVVVSQVKSPSVDESLWEMKTENLRKAPPVVIIRPARYSDHTSMTDLQKYIAHNLDFKGLLEVAYAFTNSEGEGQPFSRERMILPKDAPRSRYDLMFTLPNQEKLQETVARTTGFTARKEIRPTDVLLLNIRDPALLAIHVSKKGTRTNYKYGEGVRATFNYPIANTVSFLEGVFQKPIITGPGFLGKYDFAFQWQDSQQKATAVTQELEQAGLELVPTNMPIEMLVVKQSKN